MTELEEEKGSGTWVKAVRRTGCRDIYIIYTNTYKEGHILIHILTAVTYIYVHCGSNLESRLCITLLYPIITHLEFCMVYPRDAALVACLLVLG